MFTATVRISQPPSVSPLPGSSNTSAYQVNALPMPLVISAKCPPTKFRSYFTVRTRWTEPLN